MTPTEVVTELEKMGDELSTMFIAKLFESDDRVRSPGHVLFECQTAVEHLFDDGNFAEIFEERPALAIRSESRELFAIVPKNESAKRMLQLLNIQKKPGSEQ